MPDGLKSTKWF